MKTFAMVLGLGLFSVVGAAQGVKCDLRDYKAIDGLHATADGKSVTLTWQGEGGRSCGRSLRCAMGSPWWRSWRRARRAARGWCWVKI